MISHYRFTFFLCFLDETSFGQACFRQARLKTFCTMPIALAVRDIQSQEIPMNTDLQSEVIAKTHECMYICISFQCRGQQ